MNILVTGGAGFIGSHLTERLIREGHRVSILDDLNDFYPPAMKLENLSGFRQLVSFYQDDICNQSEVRRIFETERPRAVIHLAARAGVRPSIRQPLLYEKVNVRGTLTLLDAAREYGVEKFVFASSSSVYGVSSRLPFAEDDPLHSPISPYAATKIAGEKMCYTYSHLYGMQTACLRFFTVYGPRQRPDLAIRKFVQMIREGRPISIFGDGSSRRDYTFVDDIVQGIVAALHYDCRYEVFNLGNSHPIPLRTLIDLMEQTLGVRARITYLPDQPGDVPVTYADITKSQRLLQYQPLTPFSEGLAKFIAWQATTPKLAAAV